MISTGISVMSSQKRKRFLSGPIESLSKKKKYNCKFQPEWKKAFPFVNSSGMGNEYVYCTLCSINFSVASGGLVLPVSNADSERIFYILKKIKTDNRS